MSAHISFVCDASNCKDDHGHKAYIPILFDQLKETWADAIDFARSVGWHFELENEPNDGRVTKCLCPKHKPKEN